MSRDDQTFEPRVGKPRDQGRRSLRRPSSFTRQVMLKVYRERAGLRQRDRIKTAKPNGRFNARGRGAKVARSLPRDHGWSVDARTGLRTRDRRVIVKARVVKLWAPRVARATPTSATFSVMASPATGCRDHRAEKFYLRPSYAYLRLRYG